MGVVFPRDVLIDFNEVGRPTPHPSSTKAQSTMERATADISGA